MPKVSIIIPVYNVEAYLCQCVESARQQTLADVEIICVNDGSPDRCDALLKLYEEADSRIKVVAKPNGGLSSARNAGIAAATGEYLLFVDSDDFLELNACERLVQEFKSKPCDVVVCGAYTWPRHMDTDWHAEVLTTRDVFFPEFDMNLILKENSYPFVWRTSLRRDFLQRTGILFDESMRFGEDTIFQMAVYPVAQGVSIISDKLLDYRLQREGSLMDGTVHVISKLVKEHIAITEKVLAGWEESGFLAEHANEALDWSINFNLRHALLAGSDRDALLDELAQLFRRFFTDEHLSQRAQNNYAIKAAVYEPALRSKRSTLWSFDANHDGVSRVDAAKLDFKRGFMDPIVKPKVRGIAASVLPAPDSSLAVYDRDYDWNVQERTDRLHMLADLVGEDFDENCLRSSVQIAREKGSARKTQAYYRRKTEALQKVFASQCDALIEKAVARAAAQN